MKDRRPTYSRTYYNGKAGKCQPLNRKLLFAVDEILYQLNHNYNGKYGNGRIDRIFKQLCE